MMTFSACSNSDDMTAGGVSANQSTDLSVVAGIANAPISRAYDNKWSAGDEIGIYALNGDGSLFGSGNIQYKSTLAEGDDTQSNFAAVGGSVTLPTDGSALSVVAYYPYSSETADGVRSFDLSLQDNQAAIDLLAAKAEGINVTHATAMLDFTHKFSKIYMNVTAEDGVNVENLQATLGNLQTKVSYDILNDAVSADGDKMDVNMKVTGNEVIEAIVLPSDEANHNLKIVAGGKTYKAAINTKFEAGKKYIYNVKFTANNAVEISGCGITNWVDVPGGDVIVTPGEGGDEPSPSFGYENVWMFGSATPGGWGMGDGPVKLTKVDDNTFTAEVTLTAGEFKFPLNNDWGCDWIMATEENAPITSTACQVVKDGAPFDYKWLVTEDEAGKYNIVLNVKDMTMTATKIEE